MCKRSSFISYIKYILICLMLELYATMRHAAFLQALSNTRSGGDVARRGGEMILKRGLVSPQKASLGSDYFLAASPAKRRPPRLCSIYKMGIILLTFHCAVRVCQRETERERKKKKTDGVSKQKCPVIIPV